VRQTWHFEITVFDSCFLFEVNSRTVSGGRYYQFIFSRAKHWTADNGAGLLLYLIVIYMLPAAPDSDKYATCCCLLVFITERKFIFDISSDLYCNLYLMPVKLIIIVKQLTKTADLE
jgi:hypothetical protein